MKNNNEETPDRDEDFQMGIRIDNGADDMEGAEVEVPDEYSPDAPGAETPSGDLMLSELREMRRHIDSLSAEFQAKLKYDEHKNRIIDELHQELQTFREGVIKKHLHSVVTDVIKIADDIRKFKSHHEQEPRSENTAANLLDFMDQIASDLEDLFSWEGVIPFTCGQNTFDTTRQRIIKKIQTDDPEKNKLVAQSLRPGYEWDGKVIRPEMVSIYVFNDANPAKDPMTDG